MIFGIGTDIVQQERVRKVHEKFGERFVERLLLPAELEVFRRGSEPQKYAAAAVEPESPVDPEPDAVAHPEDAAHELHHEAPPPIEEHDLSETD